MATPTDLALVAILALVAVAGVYAYAATALWAHARLARLAPPRTLPHALLVGALMPACGCTALPYARRAPERLRAPFLVAAYAANPLLLLAAALLRGWTGAALVLGLALLAALAAALLPPGERPRTRLDDLLLRRGGDPLRDARAYTLAFAAPALGIGAALGAARLVPGVVGALALGALAVLFMPPHRDVRDDHGARLAGGVRALYLLFCSAVGLSMALL